jgi:kynurenine formamidase
VAKDPGYHLARSDIESWEKRNGEIPAGSVVMVRSDWSKRWRDPALASESVFPGVSLAALQFFHEERHIYFTATSRSTPTPLPTSKEKPG